MMDYPLIARLGPAFKYQTSRNLFVANPHDAYALGISY